MLCKYLLVVILFIVKFKKKHSELHCRNIIPSLNSGDEAFYLSLGWRCGGNSTCSGVRSLSECH